MKYNKYDKRLYCVKRQKTIKYKDHKDKDDDDDAIGCIKKEMLHPSSNP